MSRRNILKFRVSNYFEISFFSLDMYFFAPPPPLKKKITLFYMIWFG